MWLVGQCPRQVWRQSPGRMQRGRPKKVMFHSDRDLCKHLALPEGAISYENALAYADSANDLRLMIKLGPEINQDKLGKAAQNLSLEISDEPGGITNFKLE
jgi:Tfp pilus assembly ATPase PilU